MARSCFLLSNVLLLGLVLTPSCEAQSSSEQRAGSIDAAISGGEVSTNKTIRAGIRKKTRERKAKSEKPDAIGYYQSIQRGPECPRELKEEEGYYGSIKRGVDTAKELPDSEGYYGGLKTSVSSNSDPATKPHEENLNTGQVETALSRDTALQLNRIDSVTPQNHVVSSASVANVNATIDLAEMRLDNKKVSQINGSKKLKPPGQAAMSPFEEGIEYYNQRAYHAAEDSFEEACALAPADQNAHYWLGLVRVQLRDPQGARDEFETCFRICPFNRIGGQAKEQMLQQSQRIAISRTPAVDPQWMMQQTLERISNSAHRDMDARLEEGERRAQWRMELGNLQAAKIADNARSYRNEMRAAQRGNYYDYLGWSPGQEVSSWEQIDSHYALSDAQVQATHAREHATQRAYFIQDSADNLYRLLSEPWRPGRPHLRAFGTNLYVRYYGNQRWDDPGLPPNDPPLKATALRYFH